MCVFTYLFMQLTHMQFVHMYFTNIYIFCIFFLPVQFSDYPAEVSYARNQLYSVAASLAVLPTTLTQQHGFSVSHGTSEHYQPRCTWVTCSV